MMNSPIPPSPPQNSSSKVILAVLATLLAVVVIGAIAGVAYWLGTRGDKTSSPDTTTVPTAVTTPSTSTTIASSTSVAVAPTSTTPPPVVVVQTSVVAPPIATNQGLPSGLYCRDLAARGYSFSDALWYWEREGYPSRMDADKNGIPCETVYPKSAIEVYFPSADYYDDSSVDLPSGLQCSDLQARGVSTYGALVYYIDEGYPDRMDADKNGIPCETVYPDAAWVWNNRIAG